MLIALLSFQLLSLTEPPHSPMPFPAPSCLGLTWGKSGKRGMARCRKKQPPPEGTVTLTWLVPRGHFCPLPHRRVISLGLTFLPGEAEAQRSLRVVAASCPPPACCRGSKRAPGRPSAFCLTAASPKAQVRSVALLRTQHSVDANAEV